MNSTSAQPDATRLSALVDAGPEAIAILDAQWRYTYVNLSFERLIRMSAETLIGKSIWVVTPALERMPFATELRRTMEQRCSTRLEFPGADGARYDIHAMPFGDGMAFFARDITSLYRATEEARHNEERFRAILNAEPACVILLDRDGRVMDTNPAGLELLEVDDYSDLLHQPIRPFIAESDRARVAAFTEAVFNGESGTIDIEIVGCRGARRLVQHRVAPLRNSDGAIVAALSINTDVTARHQVEATLRRRALQHAVLAGLGALALRDADVDDLTNRAVEAIHETLGVPNRVALDLLWKHGLTQPAPTGEDSSAPVHLEREDEDFVRSAAHLLSSAIERRRAETVLQEREEQLRQAQKMEAIGQLAGGVAHDFNNLLTVINVHTDLLLHQLAEGQPMRGDVEEIARAAARAASLTRQLLTFSRKQVVQPQVLDLGRVVTGVEPMLRRLIGEDVDFATEIEGRIEPVLADEGEVEQILVNLVVNARDAMPQGGKLRVRAATTRVDEALCLRHPTLQPGEYVQLTVSDSGMGMTTETMARAFEPFFTTKEPGRGTGLGLSTVYGIVKQSGGVITVDSEPGAGTQFCLYLPIATGAEVTTASAPERRTQSTAGETILLVEDEDSVRRLAKRVLQAQGYTVLEAINGVDALRLAADYGGVIELLLSDVVMPELGGRLLAERLRAARPETEVLFMSGYTDDEILRRGLLERGQRLLQKPFTATALAHEVRTVLDAARRRRSSAHQVLAED